MEIKVVLHVNEDNDERLNTAFLNIKNLLKEVGHSGVSIAVLANGPSVRHFMKSMPLDRAEMISDYFDANVRVYVCSNAMAKYNIVREEIHDRCTIVKAGILKLIELQQNGHAYVKP